MPTCLGRVEEVLVPVSGPGVRSSLSPRNASDGCVSHQLGCSHEWPPRPWSVEQSPSHLAHLLPGDAGRFSSVETLSPGPNRPPCVGSHRQHSGGLLHHHQGGLRSRPLYKLAHQILVWSQDKLLSLRAVHVPGHLNMGADILSDISDLSSSTGAGCHGTDVAEASSVCFSPDRSAPGSSGESTPGRGPSSFSSPVLAGPSLVLGPDFPPRWLSMGDSRQEGSPLSGGRHHPPPSPGVVEVMGVAPEGAHLVASGLSTEVVETILQSRAPSMRKLYTLKWKLFTSWCRHRQRDPVNCPVGTVLEFLQDQFSAGLAHSILKVYMAAISAYHALLGGSSVGRNPLVTGFLHGALRLRPLTSFESSVPPHYLGVKAHSSRSMAFSSGVPSLIFQRCGLFHATHFHEILCLIYATLGSSFLSS
ncbi:hypothetical protein H4Q32_028957 [Labeo rohita]|uniref:Uncharacterized protein n=1 Tax=Labeo rohita TaxID=84645 RepID=A0ABQ8L767_LABRO|nr:hypothetical protein H4Q32_028957 [Labeo rohita]